jgi:hypothetical protein
MAGSMIDPTKLPIGQYHCDGTRTLWQHRGVTRKQNRIARRIGLEPAWIHYGDLDPPGNGQIGKPCTKPPRSLSIGTDLALREQIEKLEPQRALRRHFIDHPPAHPQIVRILRGRLLKQPVAQALYLRLGLRVWRPQRKAQAEGGKRRAIVRGSQLEASAG